MDVRHSQVGVSGVAARVGIDLALKARRSGEHEWMDDLFVCEKG
jgi:hypothetical protein